MARTASSISSIVGLALSWLIASCLPAGAQSDVRLAPGDLVLFSVLGIPDLGRETMVGPDGAIYLPLAGKVVAAGLTIDELREKVYASLSDRAYRIGVAGADDVWRKFQESELYLDISEYRPVYVTGDIRNPGEVRYRPGMSVRQVLAIAGGAGRPIEDDSEREILRLIAERSVLLDRIETQITGIERLEADLDALVAQRSMKGDPRRETTERRLGGEIPTTIQEVGQRWLEARGELRALTESGDEILLDQMENRLDVLEDLHAASEESLGLEEEEFARAEQLAERGVVPASTIAEARRALLQSSTRALETAGEVLRLRLDMARLSEEARADLTNEQVKLLEAIANGTAGLRLLESELRSLDARLAALGAIPAEDEKIVIETEIVRADLGTRSGEPALPNTIMMPGDVLEVTIVTSERSSEGVR